MRDLSIEIKVGTVVIMAIVILLYGIIWVKEYRFDVEHYEYTCRFPEVGTLDVGDPVSVLGVDKGEVKDIRLQGNTVLVKINLINDVVLKEDARFVVMNVGLMGERFVAIWPGNADKPLDLNSPRMGKYDTGIPEIMGMMGDAIAEVRALVDQLEGTFGEPGKAKEIRETVDAIHELTRSTSSFFNRNQASLEGAVNDLTSAAGSMREFLDSNTVNMQTAMDNFAEASIKLNKLSDDVKVLADKINNAEGTIGKTLADDSLYYDLRQTINNLDSLITDFKKHPKKYVHLSIF